MTNPWQATRDDILATADVISAKHAPELTVLFGSHAGGPPGLSSDVHLLVVMDTPERPAVAEARVDSDLPGRIPVDVLVRGPQEVPRRLCLADPFIWAVLTDGEVLHQAGGRCLTSAPAGGDT